MLSFIDFLVHALLLPVAISTPLNSLQARGVRFESDCDDVQDNTITPAMGDAVLLSNTVLNSKLADGTTFQASTAFSNYFEQSDYSTVHSMFTYISQSREPYKDPPIIFVCETASNPGNCGSDYALTYPDPTIDPARPPSQPQPTSGVGFCARFFDSSQASSINLYTLAAPGICQDLTFSKLLNSGLVMVHAYAMADAFGALTKLPLRTPAGSNSTHGAADWTSPPTAASARALKQAWADFNAGKAPEPSLQLKQNAYSYAAAATEFYFLQLCGKGRGDSVSS